MKTLALAALGLCLSAPVALADFAISFQWGNIPLCTTGRPNTVGNPAFVITDLPPGTDNVAFRLTDLDVPSFNHGGAVVGINTSGTLAGGIFTYRSPCPPNGVHAYEWSATARRGDVVLGIARAQRPYPEE